MNINANSGSDRMLIFMSRTTDTAESMGNSLRIDLTSGRARKLSVAAACEVFDTNKTQAVLKACRLAAYLDGENDVEPGPGAIASLLELAEEQGSLTGEEIAEVLSSNHYPVEYETTTRWSAGETIPDR